MAWLTDYSYRKSITLSRASGAVTNYQLELLVGESSGASGEDVDCGGNCASDFDDIRFTTSDGETLLDYWIESISGTTPNQLATIWIKFDSIGTGATTFYMYYGNAAAPAASNGANTFIFFDDFERGSNGDAVGGSWTVSAGAVRISTEQKFGGTRSGKWVGGVSSQYPTATIPVTASANICIRWRAFKENASVLTFGHGDASTLLRLEHRADESLWKYPSTTLLNPNGLSHSTWHLFEMYNFNWDANTCSARVNASTWDGLAESSYSWYNGKFYAQGDVSNDFDGWIDNVIVRNWRSTEPAWGSWGSEEEAAEFTELEDAALYLAVRARAPVRVTSAPLEIISDDPCSHNIRVTSAPLEIISDDPCSHNIRVTSAVLEIISTEYVVSVADDSRLELSAYYQELEDARLYVNVAGLAPLEDAAMWLRAHDGLEFNDALMYLYTRGYEYDNALMYLTTCIYELEDAALYLQAASSTVYGDAPMYLTVTDGITYDNCSLYLTAVANVPAAMSSVYHRLTSIISEV